MRSLMIEHIRKKDGENLFIGTHSNGNQEDFLQLCMLKKSSSWGEICQWTNFKYCPIENKIIYNKLDIEMGLNKRKIWM